MCNTSSAAIAPESTVKSQTYPFHPVFFILSTVQVFEMLPRNNGVATISESFTLNL